jgi:hypothetical protein
MTALDHRTAARVCRCIERRTNQAIRTFPNDPEMPDREWNNKLDTLGLQAQQWALREIEHQQAAQRLAGLNC